MLQRLPVTPSAWVALADVSPAEADCIVAVMLKILDGKCKMNPAEKVIMTDLYDAAKGLDLGKLDYGLHALIAVARDLDDPALKETVYEHRLYAETMISRPVMKGFKARLRQEGVLPQKLPETEDT